MGTGGLTVAAADAVHAVGILPDGNIKLAGLLTGSTAYAFICIYLYSVKGNLIKKAVNGSKRTDVAAEGAVDNY